MSLSETQIFYSSKKESNCKLPKGIVKPKATIINTPVLMGSQRDFSSSNCPHFLAKIADFGLKYCIIGRCSKNNISGSTPH